MVATVRARIQYYIGQGKSLRQIQAADPAQGYRSRYGSDTGSWTTNDFVEAVYESLVAERKAHHGRHPGGTDMKTKAEKATTAKAAACTRVLLCMVALVACGLISAPRVARAQPAAAAAHPGDHVILIARMTVKAGREQDFIKLIAQMKARVQREDRGNIRYELFKVALRPGPGPRSGPGAQPSDSRKFVFLEEWQDQAAAAAHGKWAGPIVRTQWRALTDSMQFVRVQTVPLQ